MPAAPLLATGQDTIEILSSDAEENPKSPSPITQVSPLSYQIPIPLEGSHFLLPQLPEVSSCEVEKIMDIDDTVQSFPPLPSLPSPPSLPLQIPQVDPTVDAIEKTLSNVSVSSSPTNQAHLPHAFGSIDNSESEGGPLTEDNNNYSHPPPPSSSSSPSHQILPSRHPTPTVRGLIYGGPNGIFRDANASIVQHSQVELPQNPVLPSSSGTLVPKIPSPPYGPSTSQVKTNLPTFICHLTPFLGSHSSCHH